MDRRDSLRALLIGSIGTGAVVSSCKVPAKEASGKESSPEVKPGGGYGRTEEEVLLDQRIKAMPSIFNDHELGTLAVFADIILPADDLSSSATEAGVVEFIDFIVKDMVQHQIPMRSAVGWVDREAQNRFEKNFQALSNEQQIEIVEDIAYPEDAKPGFEAATKLFSKVRDLVMTGFYSSQEGVKDLGYMGNVTNFWDGVPTDVLEKHGFVHEEKYVNQYITQEHREVEAKWDDEGNLVYEDLA
ncbi:MAG: gluconate 2-dehydrogenase subunit 3 family protein [Bacteroidota bacterium]